MRRHRRFHDSGAKGAQPSRQVSVLLEIIAGHVFHVQDGKAADHRLDPDESGHHGEEKSISGIIHSKMQLACAVYSNRKSLRIRWYQPAIWTTLLALRKDQFRRLSVTSACRVAIDL